jgi:hypothetical protein
MSRIPVLGWVLTLSGCAGLAGVDCGPDWYAIGQRDGRMNAGLQAQSYAARCAVQVDTARYLEGYRAGFAQRPLPSW